MTNAFHATQPLITIVIPTYNSSNTILKALSSALEQSLNSNIIVVDDCSSDDTVDLVKRIQAGLRYQDRLKVVINPRNLGGGASRNLGISLAETELIALLDADDTWVKNHLEESVNTLREQRSDFVFGGIIDFDVPNFVIGQSPMRYILIHGGMAQTSSFVFKRINGLRFDEALRKHQDFDFLMTAFDMKLKLSQKKLPTVKYNEVPDGRIRVSRQRRPDASRRFLLKWRRLMLADEKIMFLSWFHLPNRSRIHIKRGMWYWTNLFCTRAPLKLKFRASIQVLKRVVYD